MVFVLGELIVIFGKVVDWLRCWIRGEIFCVWSIILISGGLWIWDR